MEKKLQTAIDKGIAYLKAQGRLLDQALLNFFYEGGSLDAVLQEMEKFRNPDGGFGHGFECDLRCPDSSALATSEALQTCWAIGLDANHPLVKGAIEFFLHTYQQDEQGWQFIPASAMDHPRAPWWQYNPDVRAYRHNPRAEILGDLWRAREYVPAPLLEELITSVLHDFQEDLEQLQMHDLYCYLRLVRTPDLRVDITDTLMKHLPGLIEKHVDTDEEAWAGYGIRPYAITQDIHDPFYPLVAEAMPRAINFVLREQSEDGSWSLTWNWGGSYPAAWKIAETEWKSRGTLGNIQLLKQLGPVVNS